jgi:thermostable 8-oxoguanine DNA glycosylase
MIITREDRREVKKVLKKLGRRKTKESIFYDLCFCLCAPQCKFENNIKVISELKNLKFYEAPLPVDGRSAGKTWYTKTLPEILKPVRFYNNKARYLIKAKAKFDWIYDIVTDINLSGYEKRDMLVDEVTGLGRKAASHFLRNQGHDELAIIDTHIIQFLLTQPVAPWESIPTIESITRETKTAKGYENLESWFQSIAGGMDLTTAELDAIIWKQRSGTDWKEFIH